MAAPPDDLLDHDYDGIREFDNPLPKWWVYLFYGCIAFAIAYIPYYHFGPGPLPREEWAADMTQWWEDHPPPELASAAELEAMAADPAFVAAGQATYSIRCVSCHAIDGGGLVGPNLTDDFTLYGQDHDKMVAVIYHGTKNGMLAWKNDLSLTEIYQVGAYVHTLRGTTPKTAKAPQGVPIGSTEDGAVKPEPAAEPAPEPVAEPGADAQPDPAAAGDQPVLAADGDAPAPAPADGDAPAPPSEEAAVPG